MLPMLATAAMGLLAAKTLRGGRQGINLGAPSGSSLLDMLSGFLDINEDGSPVDDLLSLAKRFFPRPRAG